MSLQKAVRTVGTVVGPVVVVAGWDIIASAHITDTGVELSRKDAVDIVVEGGLTGLGAVLALIFHGLLNRHH